MIQQHKKKRKNLEDNEQIALMQWAKSQKYKNGLFCGLFIELKAKGGRVTESQSAVMQRLTEQGYCCKVCYGAEQAIEEIKWYLGFEI